MRRRTLKHPIATYRFFGVDGAYYNVPDTVHTQMSARSAALLRYAGGYGAPDTRLTPSQLDELRFTEAAIHLKKHGYWRVTDV